MASPRPQVALNSEALLSVRGLVREFAVRARGERRASRMRAVDGVDLDLAPGESLGLVGESGSGKSTLARCAVGLLAPTAGSIRLAGKELVGATKAQLFAVRRRVQMVFQDPYGSLDPRQRVLSMLSEPLAIHGTVKPRARRLRALALLDAVGLSPEHLAHYPHEFSGGQRQRLGIARALALEPDLLVLDEPVSALDVSVQAQILNLFQDLREEFGLAYLFIAHDLSVVKQLCHRVAVLYLGRIVEIAPTAQLFEAPQHPYTQALLSAVPRPHPGRPQTRELLAGDPPSPIDPPSGCAFHPRCPVRAQVAGDRCSQELPELLPIARAAGRSAACHGSWIERP